MRKRKAGLGLIRQILGTKVEGGTQHPRAFDLLYISRDSQAHAERQMSVHAGWGSDNEQRTTTASRSRPPITRPNRRRIKGRISDALQRTDYMYVTYS